MKSSTLLIVAPLLGTLGCWVPKETGDAMQRDIRLLQEQQAASQKSLGEQQARLDEQMQRADKKLQEVTRMLEDLNRAARSTDADLGVQVEHLLKDVQELRGTLELGDFRLGKIEGKLEGDGSLTARLDALEKKVAQAPPPSPDIVPKGRKELLAYAADLVRHGKAAEARGVYRDVVKQWPNEVGVTDEAYFRIGETYYDEKKCVSAVQEYIKVVEKFGNGNVADDAYYKIGLCSIESGNLEDARTFFGVIVHNYPKSPLVKDAQKKLEEVQQRLDRESRSKAKPRGK